MKNLLTVLIVLFMLNFMANASAQSTPVRIARLPIIFQSNIPDELTCNELETKIIRTIHIPLNGTLQLAEYLPPKESSQTLNAIWQNMTAQNKKSAFQDAVRLLAQELDADIIVCPVLKRYKQTLTESLGYGETILNSYVQVELIVFDRRTDTLTDKKAVQFYHDAYSLRGTASNLAKICFDRVIAETKLRQLIVDIR